MQSDRFSADYPLTGESIDQIAEKIEQFLYSLKLERANMFRVRLSMEEALLRWQDHFGPSVTVKLELGRQRRRPTIALSLAGDSYDPLQNAENDLGAWAGQLLSGIGLTPRYSYQKGVNCILLKLKNHRANPALTLLVSTALGVLLGVVGEILLPDAVQAAVLRMVLAPIQNVFFRILNAAAAPVIFFNVISAICGVGSIAEMGKSGKRLMLRFLLFSTAVTLLTVVVGGGVFQLSSLLTPLDGTQFASVLDFFLQVVPGDMISPFINGDSPQLILMAIILGNALLVINAQGNGLMTLVEHANAVGLLIAEWVSRLTPIFVTVLLILGIWNNALDMLLGLWKPLLLFLALGVFVTALFLLYVSRRKRVELRKLLRKMKDSFLIALKTSSVDEAYGSSQICCERRLGIDHKLVGYALPLGLIIYMPTATIATTVFTLYAARSYAVSASTVWYVMILGMTVALQAATPPVAGIGLLTYAVLFSRLGIPSGALTVAIVADTLFRFVSSALDQMLLQLELILEADRQQLLDENMLKKGP